MPSKGPTVDYRDAYRALGACDPALANALRLIGEPVIRTRPGGFTGLFRIIVQQQLSVASAQSILKKCRRELTITPKGILAASEADLRAVGLSGPKIRYVRAVAEAVETGLLSFPKLRRLDISDAFDCLTAIKGVGPWSASIYLLFCEGRTAVWPPRDVALLAAYTHAAGLEERPPMDEFDAMAAHRYAPHAGLAAHILWTYCGRIKDRPPV